MNFSAVILAGGKSSRMGRDKAFMEINGQSLLARQIALVREVGAMEVFISGRVEQDYSSYRCFILKDKFSGAGPLAGIERALDASKSPLLLALAVDMPNMTATLLGKFVARCSASSGVIPRVAGRIEPLAGFYPKAAWTHADRLLEDRRNAAADFAECCMQSGLAVFNDVAAGDMGCFANWNTPDDLASIQAKGQNAA